MKKVLTVLLIITSLAGEAQTLPEINPIPIYFPLLNKELFTLRRNSLVNQKDSLRQKIEQFNSKCGNVPESNTILVGECEHEQTRIRKIKLDLLWAINKFNDDLITGANQIDNFGIDDPVIGVASYVVGEVKVQRAGGKEWVIKSGIALRAGDRIITGNNSKFQVILLDETSFTVGTNSEMVLDDFVYDPKVTIGKISVKLGIGMMRFVTGKIAKRDPDRMQVTTPVIAVGIRGTDFQINILADSSGSILLYKGGLQITEKKTNKTVQMVAGQMLSFSSSGKCENPVVLVRNNDEEL